MSLWLTPDEVIELTGYRQRDKQRSALVQLAVKFKTRPADGALLVERSQFDSNAPRRREPNFAAQGR